MPEKREAFHSFMAGSQFIEPESCPVAQAPMTHTHTHTHSKNNSSSLLSTISYGPPKIYAEHLETWSGMNVGLGKPFSLCYLTDPHKKVLAPLPLVILSVQTGTDWEWKHVLFMLFTSNHTHTLGTNVNGLWTQVALQSSTHEFSDNWLERKK